MDYQTVRPFIRTGDLIAVKRRSGFLAVATRLVTKSPYTHTGIALCIAGRLVMAQCNAGGFNIIPLSQVTEFSFDVFSCPVDREKVEAIIWELFGTRSSYGYMDLFRIALYLKLGVPLPKEGPDLICSALSAKIYKLAGWWVPLLPSIPWPGIVVANLHPPIYSVTPH